MKKFFFLYVFLFVSWSALAADLPINKGTEFFYMDIDQDGSISQEEFTTSVPKLRPDAFDMLDQNHDGKIDTSEWDTFQEMHSRGGMMPHGGGEMMQSMPHDITPPTVNE